ncbi:MAG: hypothetical protein ACYCY8_10065 [Burkholderiales bacterium]
MKALVLAFMLLPAISKAESLGRLFFTPEERAMLDRQHRQPGQIAVKGVVPQESATGSVELKGGGRTVWINGVPRHIAPVQKK